MSEQATSRQQYLALQKDKLLKAIVHLNYSYKKILTLPVVTQSFDEEILETWESFAARFSRVADLFLMKYLRARVMIEDPGFSGSLRDALYFAEKLGFLKDPDAWLAIRELRNMTAHDYAEDDLASLFMRIKAEAPRLIQLKETV
jgi:hypothetical protein